MSDYRQVVFVSQHFPPDKGGNAARIHDITTHLPDQEWKVTVLTPPPSYPPGEFKRTWQRKQTDVVDGVSVCRLWSWQPQMEDPGTVARLLYYLTFGIHAMLWLAWNIRDYDALVTTTPPISTGAPGLLGTVLGIPWVVDVRDLWIDASISLGYLQAGSLLERVSRRFQWLVLHAADRITVTTEELGECLSETYGGTLASKTVVIPNGVDTERFRPARDGETRLGERAVNASHSGTASPGEPDRSAAASTGEAYGGVPTIIYTGNLGSAQDLESCIRAMSQLSHDDAVLKLVGRGDEESRLRRLTDELGVQDRVEFVGVVPREEVPGLLTEATIGIAPLQDTEELAYAMPTKVYEYMASGLPALVTGRGELERFIEQSGGGVHVENDPARIADQIERLLSNDHLRQELAEQGREHVRTRYDRGAIARRMSEELTALVEAGVA